MSAQTRSRDPPGIQLVMLLASLVTGCATIGSSGSFVLPRCWDDRYLDFTVDRASARPTLAVLPFSVGEHVKSAGDLHIGDILATALFKTGRFDMVERSKLDEILKEQRLGRSGMVDPSTAAEIGKLVGASTVVFGTLSTAAQQKFDQFAYDVIRTDVRLEARAVETSTGRFVFTETADGRSEVKVVTDAHGVVISGAVDPQAEYIKAATAATVALSEKLGRQFPVMGFIVSVDHADLMTDVGSERELAPGDGVVVLRRMERIIHPVTGKPMGWSKQILAQAQVRAVQLSTSNARVVRLASPDATIKAGDIIVVQSRVE
jgi:hypothetical protein